MVLFCHLSLTAPAFIHFNYIEKTDLQKSAFVFNVTLEH